MDPQTAIDVTRRWVSDIVIGLNFCPFAKRVFDAGLIRYVVTDTADEGGLLACLNEELRLLVETPPDDIETTLLIHPNIFQDFLEYNDFLDVVDDRLVDLELTGVIQIASFHPDYQFADTLPDAVENYTNRSPFPMLHLLREASISAIAQEPEALEEIPRRNIDVLRRLGLEGMLRLLNPPAVD